MRLGLLQCDSLDPPHIEVAGDYDTLFGRLLDRPDVELVVHRADRGDLPRSPTDCDAWLVPGSRVSVYDELAWIRDLERFVGVVMERRVPLIGVCFGHQLIGRLLGAPVARSAGGWNVGALDYEVHGPLPGADLPVASLTLIASHQDQVHELPAGTRLLLSAPSCPVAGFLAGGLLTVQGHPEFPAELACSLYASRVERLGADVVDTALATLDRPLDAGRIADAILAVAAGGTVEAVDRPVADLTRGA